jgi:hypothetical protein
VGHYDAEWQEYRHFRNVFLLALLAYLPVVGLIAYVGIKLFDSMVLGIVAWVFWAAVLMFTGGRLQYWRCPRCGEWFSMTWWYHLGLLARRCVNCGLRKYASGPPPDPTRLRGPLGI